MMLDNYEDFKALIDWIQLQEKLEDRCSKQVMNSGLYIYSNCQILKHLLKLTMNLTSA